MIRIRMTMRGPIPPLFGKRENNAMVRAALEAMGIHWHRTMMPEHFTVAGAMKYGYTPRSGEAGRERGNFWRTYTGRKLKKYHHRRPLMFTGESYRAARLRDVRATSRLARVLLHAPRLSWRNPHSPVHMLEEIRRVLPDEREVLVRVADRVYGERLSTLVTSRVAF